MPHLHVIHDCIEPGIVREHVAPGFVGWIVAQVRPHARLALLRGFDDRFNAVNHIVVKIVADNARIVHGDGIKRRRCGGHNPESVSVTDALCSDGFKCFAL